MKNSKIPWIGDIPNHWTLCSTSALFHEHKEKNKGLTCTNLLSLSYGRIRRKDINTTEGLLPESFDTYNIISSGDIVFRLTDLQNDHKSLRTALCTEQGIITSAYLTLRKNACIYERYYHYLFHIYDVCKVFYGMGDGVRQGMGWNDIKSMPLFMAPYEEQQRIADFLDRKCADIDNVLEKTKASIEEYRKLKQSVITEAVTKGVRGPRPMKDSGIEWIGEIPEDYSCTSLKYMCRMGAGKNLTTEQILEEGLYPVYGGNGIRGYYNSYLFDGKLLLVGRQGALCGNVHRVNCRFWPTEHAVVTVPTELTDIDFLYYALIGMNLNQYASDSAAQPGLSVGVIQNVKSVLPPKQEQQEIASYLDQKCSEIDSLIESKERFIKELEAYRKSLIYEYVTGKKQIPE